MHRMVASFVAAFGIELSPSFAQGNINAALAGMRTDATGSVLPGVTVAASSAGLIERNSTAAS